MTTSLGELEAIFLAMRLQLLIVHWNVNLKHALRTNADIRQIDTNPLQLRIGRTVRNRQPSITVLKRKSGT